MRLRHALIKQHTKWQQRIQAVLYHHGCPRRRGLMEGDGRDWLAAQQLTETTAREPIWVALGMIDFLDEQLAPLTKELCAWARRQTGLQGAHGALRDRGAVRSHDPRRAGRLHPVLLLPEAVRYGGMHLSRQGPPALHWALYGAAQRAVPEQPQPRLIPRDGRAPGW